MILTIYYTIIQGGIRIFAPLNSIRLKNQRGKLDVKGLHLILCKKAEMKLQGSG